jgi:hypothetical protein
MKGINVKLSTFTCNLFLRTPNVERPTSKFELTTGTAATQKSDRIAAKDGFQGFPFWLFAVSSAEGHPAVAHPVRIRRSTLDVRCSTFIFSKLDVRLFSA